MLTHIAKDQYNQFYPIFSGHPRKELMESLGRKSAQKMYVDTVSGDTRHIGYIIGGLWLEIWETSQFNS